MAIFLPSFYMTLAGVNPIVWAVKFLSLTPTRVSCLPQYTLTHWEQLFKRLKIVHLLVSLKFEFKVRAYYKLLDTFLFMKILPEQDTWMSELLYILFSSLNFYELKTFIVNTFYLNMNIWHRKNLFIQISKL